MCLLVLGIVATIWSLCVLLFMAAFGLTAGQALTVMVVITAGVFLIEYFR